MGKPKNITFPLLGVNKGLATSKQPFATAPDMLNVRLYDVLDNKARGGKRAGQALWGNGDLIGGSSQPVVAMCVVDSVL
jgi:hypothetical protein